MESDLIIGVGGIILQLGMLVLLIVKFAPEKQHLVAETADAISQAAATSVKLKDAEVLELRASYANLSARLDGILNESVSKDIQHAKQLATLRDDLTSERAEREKLERALEEERIKRRELERKLADLTKENNKLKDENKALRNRVAALEKEKA